MKIKPEFYIVKGGPGLPVVTSSVEVALMVARHHGAYKIEIIPVTQVADVTYFDTDSIQLSPREFK